MSLFEYSPDSLLADIPTMLAFPNLSDVYATWKKYLEENDVEVRLKTEVMRIVERKDGHVILQVKRTDSTSSEFVGGESLSFDEIIFAADADSCLKILGNKATWLERKVLGNVKYFYDISVTHYDRKYMEKARHFRTRDASINSDFYKVL